jgi:predicted transcriptional regulator
MIKRYSVFCSRILSFKFLFNSFTAVIWDIFRYWTMKNRSKYGVIAAILRSAMREETRTKIMYKAMLSNDQCRNYIDSLLNFGLIMEQNNGSKMVYKVTSKGTTFLDYYDQMMHLLPMSLDDNSNEEPYSIKLQNMI